jgi:hypothetical protein
VAAAVCVRPGLSLTAPAGRYDPAVQRGTTRADVHIPTVLAIGVVTFAAVTVIHEAGGHGVACILAGGQALAVSSTEMRCDGPEGTARLAVTAAGSVANIVVGLTAMAAGIARGSTRGIWSYVLWLFGATNLFHAGCYMLIGPLTNFGDWAYVARHLQPVVVWIIGISAVGYGLNVVGSRLAARPVWQPLLGVEPGERAARMRLLTRLPFAAAVVVSVAAGLLSPLQPRYALLTSVVAPLVLILLIRLPTWPRREQPVPAVPIATSWAWVVTGAAIGLGFVLILGPGVGSFAGYPIAR